MVRAWENDDSRGGRPKYKLRLEDAELMAGPWVLPEYRVAIKRAFKGIARPMWIVRKL